MGKKRINEGKDGGIDGDQINEKYQHYFHSQETGVKKKKPHPIYNTILTGPGDPRSVEEIRDSPIPENLDLLKENALPREPVIPDLSEIHDHPEGSIYVPEHRFDGLEVISWGLMYDSSTEDDDYINSTGVYAPKKNKNKDRDGFFFQRGDDDEE